MNILNWLRGRNLLPLDQLEQIKALAEQVVLAVEQTAKLPGEEKKQLAMELLMDLVRERGLDPPGQLLLEIAIEAAVRLTKPAHRVPPHSN